MSTINVPPRLRCAICGELLNEPKTLECLHTYCKECLKRFVSQREAGTDAELQIIKDGCDPNICQQINEIGAGEIEGLETNLSLVNQRKHFEHGLKILSGEIMCSDCGKDKAIYFCKTCSDDKNNPELCERCKDHHERSQMSEDHKIELLTDTKERLRSSPESATKRNAWICKRHRDAAASTYKNDIKFCTVSIYCHDCQEMICPLCAMTSPHDRHKKQEASELIEKPGEDDPKFKEEIRQRIDQTVAIHERFQIAIKSAKKVLNELTESQDKTKQAVTAEYNAIIEQLQQQRDTLLSGIDDIFERKQTNLKTQLQDFEAIENVVKNMQDFAEEMLNHFIPEEFLFANHQVQNGLKSICKKYGLEVYDCTLCEDRVISFSRSNYVYDLRINMIGEVHSSPYIPAFTADLNDVLVQDKEAKLTVTCYDMFGNRLHELDQYGLKLYAHLQSRNEDCVSEPSTDCKNLVLKIVPENAGIHKLHIFAKVGSKDVHIKDSPFNVRVVPQAIHEVHTLEGPKYNSWKPWGIAVNENNIIVSDMAQHCLHIFKQENEKFHYVRHIGEEGDGILQFKTPLGVAINPLNGEIIVADNGNNRIHCIAMNPNRSRSFGKYGSQNGDLNKPTGVAISKDGIIYVTDSGNQRIQYFTPNGEYIGFCGEGEREAPCFSEPYAVTIGDQKKVVIADRKGRKLQVINHQKHSAIPRRMFPVNTGDPYGIVFINETENVIISCSNHKLKRSEIQIYSLRGSLLKTYAYQNDGLRSLALKDNYLFVADKLRQKVVVFFL